MRIDCKLKKSVFVKMYKNMFRDPQFKKMLDLFAMLKKGYCDKTKVRIGRLQNLISSSCIGNVCSRIFSRMRYGFHNFIISFVPIKNFEIDLKNTLLSACAILYIAL